MLPVAGLVGLVGSTPVIVLLGLKFKLVFVGNAVVVCEGEEELKAACVVPAELTFCAVPPGATVVLSTVFVVSLSADCLLPLLDTVSESAFKSVLEIYYSLNHKLR